MPDDPFIVDMDPVQKMWMFYSWLEDHKEDLELNKQHAYLIGGFTNPQMLSKMLEAKENTIAVNDQDFEKSLEMVKNSTNENETIRKRKRRKKIGT